MHMVAIAWLYVAALMAATEANLVAGLATFVFYGLAPLALFWWIVGAPARKRRRLMRMNQLADQPDRADAQRDQ